MMEHVAARIGESSIQEQGEQSHGFGSMAAALVSRSLSSSEQNATQVPINEPTIRMWELNENSTHYDRMIAAPSDEELVKFWSGWAGIMLATGILTTFILIPLVFSRKSKVRQNPFNVYLIFLMLPDMLVAWICGLTCLTNAIAGHFTTPFMCHFQSFYMVAYIGANAWLNLLITRHLYKMLDAARQFQKYELPTRTRVLKEVVGVYMYAAVLGALGVLPTASWWPHKTRMTIGAACIPMDYDHVSTAFFYGVFFPLLFGIPLAYVCWAGFRIWRYKMLPQSGRRRILTIYFFRLAAVFVIMWLPGLLLLFVTSAWLNPWVQWAGGAWSHLQGMVSAIISLWKADIWKAVRDFWCCAKDPLEGFNDNNQNNRATSVVSKRPWADSSVYWSPRIGLGVNRSKQSRVSSYQSTDNDIEASARIAAPSESQSNMLVSDDSVLQIEDEELGMIQATLEGNKDVDNIVPLAKKPRQITVATAPSSSSASASLPPASESAVAVEATPTDDDTHNATRVSHASTRRSLRSASRDQERDPSAPVGTLYIVPNPIQEQEDSIVQLKS